MTSVSQTSITAAAAVVTARATRDAAVAALQNAIAALHTAAGVYRAAMAADSIQITDSNAPIAIIPGDSSGGFFPNY